MKDETEKLEQNTGIAENPTAGSVLDDDIEYTFVVPKGEIYVDPDLPASEPEKPETETDVTVPEDQTAESAEPEAEAEESENAVEGAEPDEPEEIGEELEEPAGTDGAEEEEDEKTGDPVDAAPTIVMDRRRLRENVPEPPVYASTGLPEGEDIVYTFVVPKGEIYHEPGPDEEEEQGVPAKTIVVTRNKSGEKSGSGEGYGLPAGHPEMGELAKKQAARKKYKQKKRNTFRTRFYIVLTAIILLISWFILSNTSLFTIDAIVVQGNSHYTAEEIINMGHASPGRNIIYKANIKETTEYLENNPYIKHAEVKRRLPSTLVIKVTERQERLAFKYDDDYLIMDEDGILLKKTRNVPKTTLVKGLVVSKIKLGEKIGTEDSKRMDKVIQIIKTMIKSDLFFVSIDISDEKEIKAYIYDTLVVKANYDSLIENMKNGKLHLVLEQLFNDGIKRGTITFLEDGSASFMPIF